MNKEEIDPIGIYSEKIEIVVSDMMKEVIDKYNVEVVINVFIQVSSSLMAKALIMADVDEQAEIKRIINHMVNSKVAHGESMVQSMLTIGRAMGANSTCQQFPPKKH